MLIEKAEDFVLDDIQVAEIDTEDTIIVMNTNEVKLLQRACREFCVNAGLLEAQETGRINAKLEDYLKGMEANNA